MTDLEERLFDLLGMVNDWLKYAEAKNGGLVAVAGLATSSVMSYGAGVAHPSAWDVGLLVATGGLFVSSVVVGVVSFIPKRDPQSVQPGPRSTAPKESDNLYFYGHLARLTAASLVDQCASLVGDQPVTTPARRSELDLAGQIIVNSRITEAKLATFLCGVRFFLAGIVVATVSVALSPWL